MSSCSTFARSRVPSNGQWRRQIEAWPEFNLFTGGFVLSRLPADSPRFKEGLEWQWRTLDVCVQERIDRTNPARRRITS